MLTSSIFAILLHLVSSCVLSTTLLPHCFQDHRVADSLHTSGMICASSSHRCPLRHLQGLVHTQTSPVPRVVTVTTLFSYTSQQVSPSSGPILGRASCMHISISTTPQTHHGFLSSELQSRLRDKDICIPNHETSSISNLGDEGR